MNKNALKGKSSRKGVVTQTGKLPNSFGFPSGINSGGGGITRKLTVKEKKAQKDLVILF